jgi:hypothetical protein
MGSRASSRTSGSSSCGGASDRQQQQPASCISVSAAAVRSCNLLGSQVAGANAVGWRVCCKDLYLQDQSCMHELVRWPAGWPASLFRFAVLHFEDDMKLNHCAAPSRCCIGLYGCATTRVDGTSRQHVLVICRMAAAITVRVSCYFSSSASQCCVMHFT